MKSRSAISRHGRSHLIEGRVSEDLKESGFGIWKGPWTSATGIDIPTHDFPITTGVWAIGAKARDRCWKVNPRGSQCQVASGNREFRRQGVHAI
jgi:hypothetical protein